MPAVIECPECSRKLRVPEELVGTRVKCPTCTAVFDANLSPAAPPASMPPASPMPSAPSPPASLDVGLRLSLDDDRPPSPSQESLPPPRGEMPPPPPREDEPRDDSERPPEGLRRRACPYCSEQVRVDEERCPHCKARLDPNNEERPWERPRRRDVRRDWEPHRGTLILVLGILSVVFGALFFLYVCWIPGLPMGVIAWVLGQRDLRKMKNNVMDPEGHGLTQAGWICGIIGTVLSALMGLFCIGMLGFIGLTAYSAKSPTPPPPRPMAPQPGPRKLNLDLPLRLVDYLPTRR